MIIWSVNWWIYIIFVIRDIIYELILSLIKSLKKIKVHSFLYILIFTLRIKIVMFSLYIYIYMSWCFMLFYHTGEGTYLMLLWWSEALVSFIRGFLFLIMLSNLTLTLCPWLVIVTLPQIKTYMVAWVGSWMPDISHIRLTFQLFLMKSPLAPH